MDKKKLSAPIVVILLIVCLLLGGVGGAVVRIFISRPDGYQIPPQETPNISIGTSGDYEVEVIKDKELSVHFLELGNKYTGDCTFIKVGDKEVLIDAGSHVSSVPTIKKYIDEYVEGKLDYVIVTHAHEDHYAGFATNENTDGIFDLYEVGTIIDFAQITSKKSSQKMYQNYLRERNEEIAAGAKHYTAKDCIEGEKEGACEVFDLGNGVTLEILDSKFYYEVAETENDHSVCTLLKQTDGAKEKNFLFTGDLEHEGEKELVKRNALPKVDVYKAGHHGSKTSSHTELLTAIDPDIVCICCCAGSSEYTKTEENQFPTQEFINRIAPYTDSVYVTSLSEDEDYKAGVFGSMNGNIAVCANKADTSITIYCSASTAKLKDTAWFKERRTLPDAWNVPAI